MECIGIYGEGLEYTLNSRGSGRQQMLENSKLGENIHENLIMETLLWKLESHESFCTTSPMTGKEKP